MNDDNGIHETLSVWIGEECRGLREQRGLTCAEVAETTGVELAVIEKIERGEVSTLQELAKAVECLTYLCDDPVEREPFGAELRQVDTIEQFERGQRSPRLFELRRLARGLGLQLSEPFESEDPATEP